MEKCPFLNEKCEDLGENLNINLKYRTFFKGIPPQHIKLQVPGWAGESFEKKDGVKPQPWHCQPFIEGSTYGLELIYPFDTECKVTSNEENMAIFEGDFSKEFTDPDNVKIPFANFAPGHYGFTSSLDLNPPPGYAIRLEPHPRFFTDFTNTVPIVVPGHIQRWWSKIFFIVFKLPSQGQTHIFRKGEPYGQILVVPRKIIYKIDQMTPEEINERILFEAKVATGRKEIASHSWKDHKGNSFDDTYKKLNNIYNNKGESAIKEFVEKAALKVTTKQGNRSKRIGKFIKNETKTEKK